MVVVISDVDIYEVYCRLFFKVSLGVTNRLLQLLQQTRSQKV